MARKIVKQSDNMQPKRNDRDVDVLSDEERFAVRKDMEAAQRDEFAPHNEMEIFYRLHRDDRSDNTSGMEAGRPKR